MQTNLSPEFKGTRDGEAAEAILRKCVHCGFCTATCPTYQLLGDELDGPRGRIYLMKQVLEGGEVTRSTQLHLDRCLTCRNCETTCPSGVDYGHLVDIGRKIVEERVQRPAGEKAVRWLLKEGLTSPLFAPAMKMGQLVRPLLPAALKHKVPAPAAPRAGVWPQRQHARKVLMLAGCVQPAMMPNVNSATARVLDAAGIQTLVAAKAGCCGALRTHLNDHEGGLDDMRRNIDAWWPYVESGEVEAIVMNASGCGVAVKEYGHALAHDPDYAAKAARIGALTRDLSELLPDMVPALQSQVRHVGGAGHARRLAFHPPCTLQHGQQLRGGVETHLRALGFEVSLAGSESHLCCGSAGTYSVLQPTLAYQLRDRKLGHLSALEPQAIVSANIGCIQHLQSGTGTPVRHWVEVLDDALAAAA
ncbi:MAG: glycolate oxidase subunit GlcF [Rubrivivax sp.]|jgi:glycolate oxidase iron-sulfur subunit|nr:glycolate oxidase subunit GlcF [Betaproteobacteria bacterium]MBK7515668.1 glycolate oxidase subunit GlcF [Betaproteobacteria bacterium]MBP6318445.1 glycolate oxidase subunit GlcF [Rubrivivax sp.]MBP9908892.1 glycolate oxidase subunit GlcF [Rubrivivax sp.]